MKESTNNFTYNIFFFICERLNFIIRCDCGKCKCSPQKQGQVWGRLCECDDFSCLRGSGKYNSFTNNSFTYQIRYLMFQALFKLHEFMIALKETLVLTKCALEGEIALARNVNVIQIGLVKTVLVV